MKLFLNFFIVTLTLTLTLTLTEFSRSRPSFCSLKKNVGPTVLWTQNFCGPKSVFSAKLKIWQVPVCNVIVAQHVSPSMAPLAKLADLIVSCGHLFRLMLILLFFRSWCDLHNQTQKIKTT